VSLNSSGVYVPHSQGIQQAGGQEIALLGKDADMMQKWSTRAALIGGMIFTPLLLPAALASTADLDSRSTKEARRLLKDIQEDARRVEDRALILEDYESTPNLDWGPHIYQLNRIRSEINHMGKRLSQLEAIEGRMAAGEQKAFSDVMPIIQEMAENTTDTLNQVKTYQAQFWSAPVKMSTQSIESDATTLVKTIGSDLG